LDEVQGIGGPATVENLCLFIYNQLKDNLPHISAVTVERPAGGDRCCLRV
jgi:6-pyruvoyltetrahydropterin/6-carboxytetrahydropterin synthase